MVERNTVNGGGGVGGGVVWGEKACGRVGFRPVAEWSLTHSGM